MKRPIAKPCAWIADVRFHHKVRFVKLKNMNGQNRLETKRCLVWSPNILHKEGIAYVDNKE